MLLSLSSVAPKPPEITSDTSLDDLLIGNKITLTCSVAWALPPAELEWRRGQWEPLPPLEGQCQPGNGLEDYSTCSVRRTIQRDDHGQAYVCRAWNYINEGREATSSITLTVRCELSQYSQTNHELSPVAQIYSYFLPLFQRYP